MAVLNNARWAFLLSIGPVLVPQMIKLDTEQITETRRIVENALAKQPVKRQRQVRLLLAVMRWLPLIFFLRPLELLPKKRCEQVLHYYENAPLQLFRTGFWGIKTLLFMGVFGQAAVADSLGYRPQFDGNKKLLPISPDE